MSRGSIRDLAQFVSGDAFARFTQPLEPEKLVLASYTFLPYVRSGIAATLPTPFSFAAPVRAQVNVTVPVIADVGTKNAGPVQVTVRGPGDVTGIDQAQVIRTYPLDGHSSVETEKLAHVEFDRPDFPWMFTPTAPDAQGHLAPWVTLVVAEKGTYTVDRQPGKAAVLSVNEDQLQALDDAWAWAHAQVVGTAPAAGDPQARQSIEQRLADINASMNLSRVLCPRHLDPNREYLACVVPTFQAGVEASLGQTVKTATLAPAWVHSGQADHQVVLPIYYSFSFSTGEKGDFEDLARLLHSLPAPPNVGRRRLDTSNPSNGIDPIPDGSTGREQIVEGPVVSPADPAGQGGWPSPAEQEWPAATTDVLRDQLNAPDTNLRAPAAQAAGEPTVGPPLYAGTHIARTRLDDTAPQWFQDLNLEAKNRVVAGLGTRVVQMDQEALMASAWNQVQGVEAANRALRLAQFARYVGASVHRRHLQLLPPATQLAMTERVHARVLDAPGVTIFARVQQSSLPPSVTSGMFRRLARARGPVARFAAPAVVDRTGVMNRLVAEDVGLTRDYVVTYANPDGVASVSPSARSIVTDAIAARVYGPGVSAATALERSHTALAERAAFPDALSSRTVRNLRLGRGDILGTPFATDVLARLLATMPTVDDIRASRTAALTGAGHALLLRQFVDAASQNTRTWSVDPADAQRLGLGGSTDTGPYTLRAAASEVEVSSEALFALAAKAVEASVPHEIQPAELTLEETAAPLISAAIRTSFAVRGTTVKTALSEMASRMVRPDGPFDIDRSQIPVPDLKLVARLDPAVTVTARIRGRLGVLPGWLLPTWFDDQRVEPVMVGPTFPFPMCQALFRYDKEWMIPGVAKIDKTDIVTLLQTNEEFVEIFLVGLNHEMARELLWRGYPTDARCTPFRSFWTGNDELLQPLHAFTNAPLGAHMRPDLLGRIVMLVRGELIRRYPGVVPHAVRQVGTDPQGIPLFEGGAGAKVLFRVPFEPNILLVCFDLTANPNPQTPGVPAIRTPGPPWWFLLSENPTEPRFGLDDGLAAPGHARNDLTWGDFTGDPPNSRRFLVSSTPIGLNLEGARWGSDSAAAAHLLFQLPARAAFLGTRMLTGVGVPNA